MDSPPKAAADPLEPPPERLSIAHLFLWTTMSAVLLGLDRALGIWGSRDSTSSVFSQAMALCYAPLFGASGTAVILMIWRAATAGPRFPRQPGHWLLVVSGLSAMMSLSLRALLMVLITERSWPVDYLVVRFCASLLGIVVNIAAARCCRGYWRTTFGIAVAVSVLSLLSSALFLFDAYQEIRTFDTFTYSLLSICVLVSAVADLAKRTPRDYLHWTGVVVRILYTLLTIISPYLFALLRTERE